VQRTEGGLQRGGGIVTRRILLAFIVGAVACVAPLAAEPDDEATTYMAVVEKFFDLLEKEGSGPAIDYIFSTNPSFADQKTQVVQVKTQYVAIEPIAGKLLGYDIFFDQSLHHRYAYLLVMAAHEVQPIKIEFVFYRPVDEWRIQSFRFNTDFVDDLKVLALGALCE